MFLLFLITVHLNDRIPKNLASWTLTYGDKLGRLWSVFNNYKLNLTVDRPSFSSTSFPYFVIVVLYCFLPERKKDSPLPVQATISSNEHKWYEKASRIWPHLADWQSGRVASCSSQLYNICWLIQDPRLQSPCRAGIDWYIL